MRLLTVGSLPPEWGGPLRGGVATFHASLLTGLSQRDGEVEVVGVLPPGPLERELPVPVFVRPEDVGRADFYEDVVARLRPDVVLMNHVANTIGVTQARRDLPAPALGVVHSWHNVTFRSGEEREQALAVTEEALSGMAGVVAPSRHALDEGRELGFRYPDVAEAIHYPLPPLHMTDVDVSGGERRDVVFVGSLTARKEPAALVEAVALLPDARAVLVGDGDLAADLAALVERLGLGGRVRLAGLVGGDDHLQEVRRLLLGARALCLPSRSESFGIVFIEALACGTPVIGFGPTVREIGEAMGIEIGAALDGSSPAEIAAAIERVSAAEWDRERLRRAALDAFGLTRVTDRYVEVLRRVAATSESR